MNNRINPYRNTQIQPFRQPAQRSEALARETGTVQESGASAATPAAAPPRAAGSDGLSQGEQQLIERYFPQSEAMTLRLYGLNRSTETLNPGAVGGHLDVSG